ncbi:MAG: radical SAM protein [Planctomycetota bacterium]
MISFERPACIALVRPPVLQMKRSLSSYGAILPVGLAYVAAVLRDAGHTLQVIDAPGDGIDRGEVVQSPIGKLWRSGLSPEEIVARLDPGTEILGISHMFLHEWPTVRQIAELAKERLPDLRVVLGGENATAFWHWVFKESDAVDCCVLGEGEATMLEVVSRLRSGEGLDDLEGVATPSSKAGAVQLSRRRLDLSELPRPAWEYFPVDRYMASADSFGVHRGRSIPILATRGCPYQCTFCSSPNMWTTRYVCRDPADVVDEIKSYVERYGVNNVNFCDLTAIVKKSWIIEFCDLLEKERLDLTWQLPTGTRTEALDEDVLRRLYATGCRNITYAPENGSKRMLQLIRKQVLLPRMLDCIRAARRTRIVTRVNIIIGHPKERWRDIRRSLEFLFKAALAGCQDAAVMIFAPYPGSSDFEEMRAQGKLEVTEDYYYLALARSGLSSRTFSPALSTRQLIFTQYLLLLAFYSTAYLTRPWRILGLIRSLLTGHETTQLDQLLRTKYRQWFGGRRDPKRDLPPGPEGPGAVEDVKLRGGGSAEEAREVTRVS